MDMLTRAYVQAAYVKQQHYNQTEIKGSLIWFVLSDLIWPFWVSPLLQERKKEHIFLL